MKRKVLERVPKDLRQIQSPSHRGQDLRRSSDSRFPVTPPPKATDTSCKERVTFVNLDADNRRPPRIESDNAKTSEYAFFKKLKEDASHKHQSCSKSKEAYRRRDSKPRDSSRERANIVLNKSDGVRSSELNKGATPDEFVSSEALPGSASRNTGLKRTRARPTVEDLHRKQKCMVEETEHTLKPKGKVLDLFEEAETQYRHADVFDKKRRKLLHWVRETSFPEIDDLCSNGSSLVSVLLSRLFPKSDGNNNVKNPKLMKVVPDDKSIPLPSFESDIHFKELQLPRTGSFMDLGCDPFLGDVTVSCSKKSREMVSCSYSPINDAYKNHLDYTASEPDFALLGGSAISCPKKDSNYILPLEDYGLVTSGYIKGLDTFCQPHEYMYGREPCTPMLGWDFDRMDKRKLSSLSRHRADSELLGCSTMPCPMIDSDYVLRFRDYGLREPSVKELDIFCQPNEYMVQKARCAPMLGWDFDSTNEERNAYSLSGYRADCELLGGSAVSCSMGDAYSVVPFNGYRLRASSHVEEMDVFCQPSEYFVGKEPCTLMLGWYFDSANEERNSSNLLGRRTAEHTSSCITSYHNHDVERQCLEGKYDLQSDFHQIELPSLSCIPTYLNEARGCTDSRIWEGGTPFSSVQDDHWFKQKIINEGHPYPNAESLLQLSGSSGEHYSSHCHALQFPREEDVSSQLITFDDMDIRYLNDSTHERVLSHFIEDNFNIHNSSALCLQISLNRQKAWPLRIDIDKATWDGNEKEVRFGDFDVNYIQL
ncbi:hypothetical protein ACLB2K_016101 [Fragaria x ananassa]